MCARITGIVLGAIAIPLATGGIIRHDRTDSQYADVARMPQFEAFARTLLNGQTHCGAVMLTPEWALTSASCVSRYVNETLEVQLGLNVYALDQVLLHPMFTDSSPDADVALLHLATPPPSTATAKRNRDLDEIGRRIVTVGVGETGDGFTGIVGPQRRLMGGENVLDVDGTAIGLDSDFLLADFDNPIDPADSSFGSPIPLDLEYLPTPGENGAPVWSERDDGQWEVVGIQAGTWFTHPGEGQYIYGDVQIVTRITSYNEWIDSVIPEPASAALLLLGVAIFWPRRP